jgi:hypothetical protein
MKNEKTLLLFASFSALVFALYHIVAKYCGKEIVEDFLRDEEFGNKLPSKPSKTNWGTIRELLNNYDAEKGNFSV